MNLYVLFTASRVNTIILLLNHYTFPKNIRSKINFLHDTAAARVPRQPLPHLEVNGTFHFDALLVPHVESPAAEHLLAHHVHHHFTCRRLLLAVDRRAPVGRDAGHEQEVNGHHRKVAAVQAGKARRRGDLRRN